MNTLYYIEKKHGNTLRKGQISGNNLIELLNYIITYDYLMNKHDEYIKEIVEILNEKNYFIDICRYGTKNILIF